MNSDEVFSCGGFDPYNSATTDAKWFFLRAARDESRRANFRELFESIKKNPQEFIDAVGLAVARMFR